MITNGSRKSKHFVMDHTQFLQLVIIESLPNDLNINANVNELMFEVYLKTGCVSEFSFPLFVRLP